MRNPLNKVAERYMQPRDAETADAWHKAIQKLGTIAAAHEAYADIQANRVAVRRTPDNVIDARRVFTPSDEELHIDPEFYLRAREPISHVKILESARNEREVS